MSDQILLSAHQPVYLPWLGLFHKIAVADVFVIFDMVPYSRKMFYNRNKILTPNGPTWLSVPVIFSQDNPAPHCEVPVDNTANWRHKHWRSIEMAYVKAPYFKTYADRFKAIYDQPWERLLDLNEALLRLFMDILSIDTPLVRGSDKAFRGQKSDLVLDMCVQMKADAYLFGKLGRDYADTDAFLTAGVAPLFQEYVHPVYEQWPGKPFEPYMCGLDLVFFHGGDKGREIMMSGNPSREECLAEAERMKEAYRSR